MELRAVEESPALLGAPEWIQGSLNVKPGRDPLGLMTITQDRILPQLLPGILVLSQRARYFSYYAFLLSEYERHKLPASATAQSDYVRQREYEFGVALELCPRQCGAPGMVGRQRTGPAARGLNGGLKRGESVESFRGGYGLYYRTPLAELGLVVRSGTLLGDEPTPVDVLVRSERSEGLAQEFRSAIEHTAYYRQHMHVRRGPWWSSWRRSGTCGSAAASATCSSSSSAARWCGAGSPARATQSNGRWRPARCAPRRS